MSLTTEQLEHAIWCAREACDKNYGGADVYFAIAEKTVDALEAELHRRKHGPYSLSEAIASGRPFRRKGWRVAMWVDEIRNAMECEGLEFCVDGQPVFLVGIDDIKAMDYELQEVQE